MIDGLGQAVKRSKWPEHVFFLTKSGGNLPSLKRTATLQLEMDAWNTFSFPFGALCMFSGAFWLVLYSECKSFKSKLLGCQGSIFCGWWWWKRLMDSGNLTKLAETWTLNEDVFPIPNGDIPLRVDSSLKEMSPKWCFPLCPPIAFLIFSTF